MCTSPLCVVVTTYNAFDVTFMDDSGSPDPDPANALRVDTAITDVKTYSEISAPGGGSGSRKPRILCIMMPAVESYGNVMDVMNL